MIDALLNQPVWITWGLGCLSLHTLLYVFFARILPKGPWTELPAFTAHQVVALLVMVYTTVLGFHYWFSHHNDPELPSDMVMDVNTNGLYFGHIVIGGMLLWDIPSGFLADGMGDPIMHAHHVGMLLVAAITVGMCSSQPLGSCYAPFFFGVIELSSIPLAIVDVFHPKQAAWHDYHLTSKVLVTINEVSRILFALLFLLVRAIYFPYVTLTQVIPDFIVASTKAPQADTPAIWTIIALSLLFTGLQLYWGSLVVKQVAKALGGGGSKASSKKE
jgi:hypothetical protein